MNTTPTPARPVVRLGQPDWWLLAIAAVLLAMGLTMVFSASGILADHQFGDAYYYSKRQLVFAAVGGVALALFASMPRHILYSLQYPILIGVFVLLVVTLSPLGIRVNGAQRWIDLGIVRMQAMEFAKIGLIMYLAYFMSTKQAIIKTFNKGVIPPFIVTALMCLLLLKQPDFGGATLLLMLLFFMCLVGGTRLIYLVISAALALGGAYLLITKVAYRSRRLLAFRDPFAVASDEGYQLVQSQYALGNGGITGVGLGASKQKLFYLPEAHTDFIIAVMGEEIGLIGLTLFFILVGILFWRGIRIALLQESLRDRFTAFGMVLVLKLSFVLNMAVVLSAAPPKGVPMPFLSYGGSSLIASLICIGILLNLSRTSKA